MGARKKAEKKTKAPGTKRRRGVKIQPTTLTASELAEAGDVSALSDQVAADGGTVLASYREPLGGNTLLLVALPVEKVHPTAFQRDVSDAHVRKLTRELHQRVQIVARPAAKRFEAGAVVGEHRDLLGVVGDGTRQIFGGG